MALDIMTLSQSKGYTNLVALGLSNVTVNGTTVTFELTDGETASVTLPTPKDGVDGISVTGVNDKGNGKFTLTLSNGTETGVIQTVKGEKGDKGNTGTKGTDGYSPTATVSKTGNKTTITITDKNGTTTADVLDGTGGGVTEDRVNELIDAKLDSLIDGDVEAF